jgi:putative transferase (TIGR04331 family)
MNKKLLVTSPISKQFNNFYNEISYLGAWCFGNNNSIVNSHEYHWSKISKKTVDYEYLKKLTEQLAVELSISLNFNLKQTRTDRYYKTILLPWLYCYLNVMFDRWETVQTFNLNPNEYDLLVNDYAKLAPNDYDNFIELSQDHLWNEKTFENLFDFFLTEKKMPPVNKIKRDNEVLNTSSNPWKKTKKKIVVNLFYLVNKYISKFFRNNKYLFMENKINLKSYIILNFSLFNFPCYVDKIFDHNKILDSSKLSRNNFRELPYKELQNSFEKYIYMNILKDMPNSYLEHSDIFNKLQKKIILNPKIVISGTAHFHNELFKYWVANRNTEDLKTTIIYSDHGGCIPNYFDYRFYYGVSDIYFVWSKTFDTHQIQTPPTKMFNNKINNLGSNLLIIGNENSLYTIHIANFLNDDCINSFNLISKMYDNLSFKIKSDFIFRPYANYGWNIADLAIEKFGSSKVSRDQILRNSIAKSKIIVCTYAETTLMESLLSGIPTLLLLLDTWKFHDNFQFLINKMIDKKILFTNADDAAFHINEIWDQPLEWWNSTEILKIREEMELNFCNAKNGISEFVKVLSKIK